MLQYKTMDIEKFNISNRRTCILIPTGKPDNPHCPNTVKETFPVVHQAYYQRITQPVQHPLMMALETMPPATPLHTLTCYIFCLGSENEFNAGIFHDCLDFICNKADDVLVVVPQVFFDEYIYNFEAFEYEIGQTVNECENDCELLIINKPYSNESEDSVTPKE